MRFFFLVAVLAGATGCGYRRNCHAPIVRFVHAEESMVPIARRAAEEWSRRTGGGERVVVSPGNVANPAPGDVNLGLGALVPPVSGLYDPGARRITIDPNFSTHLDVVAHELGHAMGLLHSDVSGALMHPSIIGMSQGPEECQNLCCK